MLLSAKVAAVAHDPPSMSLATMEDPSAVEALKDEIVTLKNTLNGKMEQLKQIGGDPTIPLTIAL